MADTEHSSPQAAPRRPAPRRASLIANILAVAGFIILAVIIIWGLIHLVRLASPSFDSLFDWNDDEIEISAPASAQSGTPFTISWDHDNDGEGMYAFEYACQDGLQMGIPVPGGSYGAVPCDVPITLGDATSTLMVLPIVSTESPIDAAVRIVYIPRTAESSEPSAEGQAIVAIRPGEQTQTPPTATTTPQTPTPTTPRPTTPPPARPATPADLSVTIVSATTDQYGNSVVTFRIANVGGTTSGSYRFTATLPTAMPYTYASVSQSPLTPGSNMLNTLRFSQTIPGSFTVNVLGDAYTANNFASRYLSGPYQYNYTNPNPYPIY